MSLSETQPQRKVLVVEDDPDLQNVFRDILTSDGYLHIGVGSAEEALSYLQTTGNPDLIFLDVILPGMDGHSLLAHLKNRNPDLPVVIMTAQGTPAAEIETIKRGAYDYLPKPFEIDEFLGIVRKATTRYSPSERIIELQQKLREQANSPLNRIVGSSRAIHVLRKQIGSAASDEESALAKPVLIMGGLGTEEKEALTVARTIHDASNRNLSGEFIRFDPTDVHQNLLEKWLYGSVPEGYPGATDAPGVIELANNGTLFVPDLASVPRLAQSALVKVIHDHSITRIGSLRPINNLDVRVIAYSSMSPTELFNAGELVRGLVYGWPIKITIPDLNDRKEDIPEQTAAFFNDIGWEKGITDDALEYLQERNWSGNVQELWDSLGEAIFRSNGRVIGREHFHLPNHKIIDGDIISAIRAGIDLPEALYRYERLAVDYALRLYGGDHHRAAKRLNIPIDELEDILAARSREEFRQPAKRAHKGEDYIPPVD